jgi:hypothetical protein
MVGKNLGKTVNLKTNKSFWLNSDRQKIRMKTPCRSGGDCQAASGIETETHFGWQFHLGLDARGEITFSVGQASLALTGGRPRYVRRFWWTPASDAPNRVAVRSPVKECFNKEVILSPLTVSPLPALSPPELIDWGVIPHLLWADAWVGGRRWHRECWENQLIT